MLRLKKLQDVLDHKDNIPTLAYIRGLQCFSNPEFKADIDGWIVVLEKGDLLTQIKEIGNGLFDDDVPTFEFVEAFVDGDQVTFELVYQLDDSRTVAVIIPDAPWLDADLRRVLMTASTPPTSLPQLKEVMP